MPFLFSRQLGRTLHFAGITAVCAMFLAAGPSGSVRKPPSIYRDASFVLGVPEATISLPSGRPVPDEPPTYRTRAPKADEGPVSVRFERCCAGFSAPSYAMELRGDGSAVYVGDDALVTGTHRFIVAPKDVKAIVEQLRAADFWSLAPAYDCGGSSHSARLKLTVKIGDQAKTVVHRAGRACGFPLRIVKIEHDIIKVADGPRWLIGNGRTLEQLRREGFDHRSMAGADFRAKALQYSSDAFVRTLLNEAAPLQTSHGPLVGQAAFWNRLGAFRALVAEGAFSDDQRGAKQFALQQALASGELRMVREVLAHRPDVNVRLEEWGGRTPIEYARMRTPEDAKPIVDLLIAAGATQTSATLSDQAANN